MDDYPTRADEVRETWKRKEKPVTPVERLRALEKKWRDELPYKGSAWEERHDIIEECADEYATLIAELGQEVAPVSAPEGWALVPKQMALTPEALGLIETMCAGPDNEGIGGEGGEDRWVDGLLWVGETIGDDGEKYWGLNIACAECLDEGSLPIFEFDRPTSPAHTSEARDWEGVEHVASHIENAVEYITKQYPDARMLDRAPIMRNMRRWARNLRAAMRQEGGK